MPIRAIDDSDNKLTIEIDNGDLKALNEVVEKWGFLNKETAIRFCVAVLSLTENGSLYMDKEGNKVVLKPQDALIKSEKLES